MTSRPRSLLAAIVISASLLSPSAQAIRVMDLRAEQLMLSVQSIRETLELTPNQQTLWQQSVARAQAILRARQTRRDKLQVDLRGSLSEKTVELREVNTRIDDEASATVAEDQQLRELWLTVNDSLTDLQRARVIELLASQLDRVESPMARPSGAAPGGRGQGGPGGKRPRGGGGAGGIGGMGMGAGG